MNAIWRTIRGYILWQHERGTLHYDIMVTLIIIFVLFSPRVINFNDKPISRNPHPTEVVVTAEADGHLSFQVAANAVTPGDDVAAWATDELGLGNLVRSVRLNFREACFFHTAAVMADGVMNTSIPALLRWVLARNGINPSGHLS